jgi:resuscitation-promoting factor RpfA
VQPPATLPELVDQLGRTYSPFERLKILGRGWALLRKMTREQRMIVAAQLGLDHADEVVEAIAKRSGQQASPALIAMIEKAQVKGTPHLPELIADLRDPKRRAERLKQGATALEGALDSPTEAPRTSPAAAPQRPAAAAPAPAPQPASPPAPPAAAAPVAPAPASPPAEQVAPAVAAPPPLPAQPTPAPEPKPEETAPPPRPSAVTPAAPPAPRVELPRDGALAERLSAATALTARFSLLRRHLDDAKGMSIGGLRAVLEGFPDGWARRRALLELLRRGVPGSLGDALALVEALGSDRDRLWCLGALADSREIPERDHETLLAVARSPMARRRLERRLGGG